MLGQHIPAPPPERAGAPAERGGPRQPDAGADDGAASGGPELRVVSRDVRLLRPGVRRATGRSASGATAISAGGRLRPTNDVPDGVAAIRCCLAFSNTSARSDSSDFVDNLCRRLLSYALGRRVLPSDAAARRQMPGGWRQTGIGSARLVETLVTSPQFLHKRVPQDPARRARRRAHGK